MCGIYGHLCRVGRVSSKEALRYRDKLAHRGPDDAGLWESSDGRVVLGHRRLAIIDLSPGGHQPMVSTRGRYVIVFNGEIYNYLEIRDELRRAGHRFRGDSDTEVVLSAYVQWGDACLNRFNGMFAFAIYDSGSETAPAKLFVARDRVGKKPLYYTHDSESFAFGSELKALKHSHTVDLRALNFYLALGYVPGDLCIASGVLKLPPAHAGVYRLDNGELRVWRYWQLPKLSPDPDSSAEALADEAERLLRDSVRLRLRSDVPVGVLLSGGLDSSLVAAAAAAASDRVIKTFTVSFPGTRYDEAGYASLVAKHLASEHHVLELPAPSLDTLEELAPFVDEPIADSSLIPAYLVSKLTVGHVKVALGGDGGDELFGGYPDYTTAFADQRRIGWLAPRALKVLAQLAGLLPAGIRGRNRLFALQGGAFQSLIWGSPYFDIALRKRIFDPGAVHALGRDLDEPERWLLDLFRNGRDPVDSMTRTHFGSILPDDFLTKVDRASMAVSLELRCPLLDYRLVEFAFGKIPSEWKVRGGEARSLERKLGERLLPATLDLNRKQGFSIPLNEWLRAANGAPIEETREWLPRAISARAVDGLLAGQRRGRANGGRLFSLIMLALAGKSGTLQAA